MAVLVLYADDFSIRPKTSEKPSDSLNESAVKCNWIEFTVNFSLIEVNVCKTYV